MSGARTRRRMARRRKVMRATMLAAEKAMVANDHLLLTRDSVLNKSSSLLFMAGICMEAYRIGCLSWLLRGEEERRGWLAEPPSNILTSRLKWGQQWSST